MQDMSYVGKKPDLVTPLHFDTVDDVEVDWLWEPFIPFGDVTIVEGDGMAGKTTAMIRLASLLSKGETPPSVIKGELIQGKSIEPSNVLYIGIEANNETEIKPAIRYGKGDYQKIFFLDQSDRPFLLTEEYVREAIEKTQCRLIIIDPYSSFLPKGTNPNNPTSMRYLLSKLMKVARETKTAIVLVGHLSKSPYGKAIYSGYGSADIINTVRRVLLMEHDDNGIRYLRILKSNYFGVDAFFKVALAMDDENCIHFEDYGYILSQLKQEQHESLEGLIDQPEQKEKLTRAGQCAANIMDILSDGPMKRCDVYEVLGANGFSERTISRAFKNMGGESYYEGRTVFWKLADEEDEE